MEEILVNIAKMGPVVGLLIAAIWYFLNREKVKDQEIKELRDQMKESDKENLTALLKVSALIEKLIDKIDNLKR